MDTDYHTTNTSISTYFCLLLPSATLYTSCIRVCLCAKLRGVQDARGRRAKFSQLASEQQASLERFPLCTRTMDDWNYCECGPSISQFSTAFIPLSFARRNWTNVPLYLFTYTLSYPMYCIACPFNERLSTGPWRRFLLSLESNVVDGHFPPFQPFTTSALFSSISSQLYFAPFSLLAVSSRPGFFFATKFPFFLFVAVQFANDAEVKFLPRNSHSSVSQLKSRFFFFLIRFFFYLGEGYTSLRVISLCIIGTVGSKITFTRTATFTESSWRHWDSFEYRSYVGIRRIATSSREQS